MKGLIYKDALTLVKQMRFYLLLVLVFALLPIGSLSSFALVYAAMLPFSAMAYDEQAKWPRLAAMLPYTDGQLVLCKYIIGWVGVLAALLLSLIAGIGTKFIAGSTAPVQSLRLLPMAAAMALLLIAVVLPLIFRFGVERGRMFSMAVIVLGAIGIAALGEMIGGRMEGYPWALAAFLLAALLNTASFFLSLWFYRKKAKL